MIKELRDLFSLSQRFGIATEDILFVDINISGINVDIDADRVRFYVNLLFGQKGQYFCALQIRRDSKYLIKNGTLYFENECIGEVSNFEVDFCDTYYMRRNGTVLNVNPKSRIDCQGCKFCYTSHQKFRNIIDLTVKDNLDKFFKDWMITYGVQDLSSLYQIAVVSGCFPNESSVVNFLTELNHKSKKLNFKGEIFYLGSQIRTSTALEKLSKISNFAYCITLECFNNRDNFLKKSKSKFTAEQIKEVMKESVKLGFRTNFTYIVGLEDLEKLKVGFMEFIEYTNSFPVINIFQEHQYQIGLRTNEASNIEFYLKARKIIEDIYVKTKMRPKTWEVCRSLWYTTFANEILEGIRLPDLKEDS